MPVRREGAGASAAGQSVGMCQRVEGVAATTLLFLAPRLALTLSTREREAGVRGRWQMRPMPGQMRPMPTPTLRPHCPVSSSSDSKHRPEGMTPNRGALHWGNALTRSDLPRGTGQTTCPSGPPLSRAHRKAARAASDDGAQELAR